MDLIISVALAIALFICFIVGYREGLRLGMRSAKGIEPKPIKNPITAVKEAVKQHAEEKKIDKLAQAYDAFEKYDGYTETEREWIKGGGCK